MNEIKRHSLDESSAPISNQNHDPNTGIQRSKTVRNLKSNVRGFFRTKNKDSINERQMRDIPDGYPVYNVHNEVTEGIMSHDKMDNKDTDLVMQPPPLQKYHSQPLLQEQQRTQEQQRPQELSMEEELERLNELIAVRTLEIQKEKEIKEKSEQSLREAQRVFQEREQEYTAIEHSFFEYTRGVRATDDDLSTIRDAFKLLKYSISRLIMTLNKKGDKEKATEKYIKLWPTLNIVDPATGEMEANHVNLLAEKLVNEHLVKNVFNAAIYPGLDINEAYSALSNWLNAHDSHFSVRLRQQMAAVVAKSGKGSEIQLAAQKEKKRIAQLIYDDLAEIYQPFLRTHDASVEEDKSYFHKICDIVDKALRLVVAIRGQEVEITTVPIQEGYQQFDEEIMTDTKCRSSGLVRFYICPAFIGGDREHGFLEKGKVVISG